MELSWRALSTDDDAQFTLDDDGTSKPFPNFPSMESSNSDEQDGSNSNNTPFIDERLGLIIFLVSTITSVVLVLTMVIREYYFKKYGIDVCPLFGQSHTRQEVAAMERRRRLNSEQQDADRALAEELQRQLNEEEREAERMVKRKERRRWYEYFMKPYCMIVQASDIFYAKEEGESNPEDEGTTEPTNCTDPDGSSPSLPVTTLRKLSTTELSEEGAFTDDDDEEIAESATTTEPPQPCPIVCDQDDEHAHRYLKLPVKTKDGTTTCRHVDGQCALCIDDYEEGDEVVWSDLECLHAFHKECILQWLSKGKKRCPICRHWFVPGARIDDQKQLHGEAWERYVAELSRLEREEAETRRQQDGEEPTDLESGNVVDLEIAPTNTEESELDDNRQRVSEPQCKPTEADVAAALTSEVDCSSDPVHMVSRKSSESSELDLQGAPESSRSISIETIDEGTCDVEQEVVQDQAQNES